MQTGGGGGRRTLDPKLDIVFWMLFGAEQNRPLLVAVNMDGEIASEHFAGVRYRDPESAALLAPFVCVMASVYRHTPRDYDERGGRVECPRFGTIPCGEHIEAERELLAQLRRATRRSLTAEKALQGDVLAGWDAQEGAGDAVEDIRGIAPFDPDIVARLFHGRHILSTR